MEAKQRAAEKAVEEIRDGMIVGLGTGSTAFYAIQKIGERVKSGLRLGAVATSLRTEQLAREFGIPMRHFSEVPAIDLTIDGADEVDRNFNLIKGGGGALLREKIIGFNSKTYYIIVDEKKVVGQLGRFALPVEILPFGMELTLKTLKKFCKSVTLRKHDGACFVTDNGNLIADLEAFPIDDPKALSEELHRIPGVLETGLFPGSMVTKVIVGKENCEVVTL